MIQDIYCSNCGSLLRTTDGICPKCGESNESIHQPKSKSLIIDKMFLIYVFIGSILLPLCSTIFFGIYFKFIPVNNIESNLLLEQIS